MNLQDVLINKGCPKGSIDSSGVVTISYNMFGWFLEAPQSTKGEKQQYLPCEDCGNMLAVPINFISYYCDECLEKETNKEKFLS